MNNLKHCVGGGPAYPTELTTTYTPTDKSGLGGQVMHTKSRHPGMTLLGYFAGQVATGDHANSDVARTPEGYVEYAYDQAQLMLAEGEKRCRP